MAHTPTRSGVYKGPLYGMTGRTALMLPVDRDTVKVQFNVSDKKDDAKAPYGFGWHPVARRDFFINRRPRHAS